MKITDANKKVVWTLKPNQVQSNLTPNISRILSIPVQLHLSGPGVLNIVQDFIVAKHNMYERQFRSVGAVCYRSSDCSWLSS